MPERMAYFGMSVLSDAVVCYMQCACGGFHALCNPLTLYVASGVWCAGEWYVSLLPGAFSLTLMLHLVAFWLNSI